MEYQLPLDKMSQEEKLLEMERIWQDLAGNERQIESPSWHENILKDRQAKADKAQAKFIDLAEAKIELKRRINENRNS